MDTRHKTYSVDRTTTPVRIPRRETTAALRDFFSRRGITSETPFRRRMLAIAK